MQRAAMFTAARKAPAAVEAMLQAWRQWASEEGASTSSAKVALCGSRDL